MALVNEDSGFAVPVNGSLGPQLADVIQHCSSSAIIHTWVAGTIIAFSYVVSLYIHPYGEKLMAFPNRNRDDPAEIKSRFIRVFVASSVCSIVCIVFQHANSSCKELTGNRSYLTCLLGNMGFRMSGVLAAATIPVLLTAILFTGPIVGDYFLGRWNGYNRAFVTLMAKNLHYRRRVLRDSLYSWMWWRAYVVAPLSEEFVYRACLIPVIAPCYGKTIAIIVSPLSFGAAHLHHIFDRIRLGVSVKNAIITTVFQLMYTSLFGVYSAYLFVRTGHVLAPILVHALCNLLGVPEPASLMELSPQKRFIVVALYFIGLGSWILLLDRLTTPELYGNV